MDYEVGNVANLVSKSPKRKLKTPNKQTPKKENNSPKKQMNGNTPKGNNQQNKGKQTPKNKQTPKGKQAKHVKPQEDDEEEEVEQVQVAKQLPKGKKQNAKNKQPPKGKKQVQKEEEPEDSDEEMDDSEESVENGDVANKLVMESDDDEDSDEEEEEDDDDDDDDDEDEDAEEEEASEDDDSDEESQEKPGKKVQKGKKEQVEKKEDDPTVDIRTIFVGNWPIDKTETALEKQFKKYGTIKSMRFRNIPVKDVRTPKKVAAIKKEFHPQRTSCCAFVVFEDQESAKKAVAENGKVFHNHHLRVEVLGEKVEYTPDKAIFIGNLAFTAEDDDVWEAFEGCGKIHSVRVMRDQKSQMSKGYGYVNFESNDAVELAVNLENVVIKDRKLNICRFTKQQRDKKTQKRKRFGGNDGSPNKKQKFNKNQKEGGFAGQKAQQNNKNKKFDKGAQQKKQMQKKFNPKKKVAASE